VRVVCSFCYRCVCAVQFGTGTQAATADSGAQSPAPAAVQPTPASSAPAPQQARVYDETNLQVGEYVCRRVQLVSDYEIVNIETSCQFSFLIKLTRLCLHLQSTLHFFLKFCFCDCLNLLSVTKCF